MQLDRRCASDEDKCVLVMTAVVDGFGNSMNDEFAVIHILVD